MTILITGYKGFIGRHVYKHFSVKEECVGIDIVDGNDILTCELPQCDTIIHLAARAGVRKSWKMPDEYWQVNVEGSRRIFQHAERIGARVLYASSSSVKEWYLNPYATTKKVVEEMAPPRSLGMRFHTVYGPDSRPDMLYDMLIKNKATYVTYHWRDFTHVNDVVSAIDVLYTAKVCGVVDVGSANPVRVVDVACAAGRDLPLRSVSGEQTSSHADISVLRSLGWSPSGNVIKDIQNAIL